MHVSQENIEELFFDYFEGTLSDVDKTELLQFVHLHPEFEKDFAQWAQAYVPVEELVPDYGIASSLLKKTPVLFPLKQWVLGGTLLVSLVVLLSVPFWKSSKKEAPLPSPTVTDSPHLTPQIVVEEKLKIELKSPIKVSRIWPLKEQNRLPRPPISPKTEEAIASGQPIPFSESTSEITVQETALEEVPELVASNPDSILPKIVKGVKPSIPFKKKKKQKLPLNLKPSPYFMPVNDNF